MRAADAIEKVCRDRPEWFVHHVERLLGEVASIERAVVLAEPDQPIRITSLPRVCVVASAPSASGAYASS
jgi:hypothetical protein